VRQLLTFSWSSITIAASMTNTVDSVYLDTVEAFVAQTQVLRSAVMFFKSNVGINISVKWYKRSHIYNVHTNIAWSQNTKNQKWENKTLSA